jgi:hypothetical protein
MRSQAAHTALAALSVILTSKYYGLLVSLLLQGFEKHRAKGHIKALQIHRMGTVINSIKKFL